MQEQTPDLVLLDINLPGISGLEVALRLRKNPALHEPPLVAVTADAFVMQKEPAMKAGFDEYVTKPVDIKDLVRVISRHLTEDETEAPSNISVPGDLPNEARMRVEQIWEEMREYPDFRILDLRKPLREKQRLCEGFQTPYTALAAKIREAVLEKMPGKCSGCCGKNLNPPRRQCVPPINWMGYLPFLTPE